MRLQAIAKAAAGAAMVVVLGASGWMAAQTGASTVLKPVDLEKLLPATVYYCGQSAPTQLRNSGGVKFADGHYVLTSLVDTSGYSTGVAEKYQGYLITEVPLKIGDKTLPAGAYGFGFLGGSKFLVTDLGGNDVFAVKTTVDEGMRRPRPLQVLADDAGVYRLYAGRSYVKFDR
ncbi:MAG: hypothetical protein ACLQG3_19560 [Terracidiphilus sp.]